MESKTGLLKIFFHPDFLRIYYPSLLITNLVINSLTPENSPNPTTVHREIGRAVDKALLSSGLTSKTFCLTGTVDPYLFYDFGIALKFARQTGFENGFTKTHDYRPGK